MREEAGFGSGLVAGTFDLAHPGHVLLIQHCARMCSTLFVALQTDPTIDRPEKNKPVETTFERYTRLSAMTGVFTVIPYDTERDLDNMLRSRLFDVRFVGDDHQEKLSHVEACSVAGVETVIVPRLHDWSSSALRCRVLDAFESEVSSKVTAKMSGVSD